MRPMILSIEGLPGAEGSLEFRIEPNTQLALSVNGTPVVGIELAPETDPKLITVGGWPNGEEWERFHAMPIPGSELEIEIRDYRSEEWAAVDPEQELPPFGVVGDLRGSFPTCETNHEITERVRRTLARDPLLSRLEFDSESACFYGYAANRADAEALVDAIQLLADLEDQ